VFSSKVFEAKNWTGSNRLLSFSTGKGSAKKTIASFTGSRLQAQPGSQPWASSCPGIAMSEARMKSTKSTFSLQDLSEKPLLYIRN
jgi:hypothetical protein